MPRAATGGERAAGAAAAGPAPSAAAALLDAGTGLPTNACFDFFLEKECAAAVRGRRLAVVVFLVDPLSAYRAAEGGEAAERALQFFAAALLAVTRRMNIATRLGDDCFACTLADGTLGDVMAYVSRVAERTRRLGSGLPITLSVGIAEFGPAARTPASLLAGARGAARAAHAAGGNAVRTHPLTGTLPRSQERPASIGEAPAG